MRSRSTLLAIAALAMAANMPEANALMQPPRVGRKPKQPDPERQAAAEAKRQRKAAKRAAIAKKGT